MMLVFNIPRVKEWLSHVFGPEALTDSEERALRFGEESLELIQSLNVTREQALALVQQVYDKPVGEPMQELGGTLVTLASLCAVTGLHAGRAYQDEWDRVDRAEIIEKIRGKHKRKAVVSSRYEGMVGYRSDGLGLVGEE